jgi:23S rRNA (guanosine2251-2'-O)-methyltransferase
VIIFGIHTVLEALKAGRVREIRVGQRNDERLRELLRAADAGEIRVRRVPEERLGREAKGGAHQGVVADVEEAPTYSVEELVAGARDVPLIVVLDGVEDPHNMGAILRSADAAGADGVVVQRRRSAARGDVVAKASAGAIAHVRLAEVVNVARCLEDLKRVGVWSVGLAADADTSYDAVDLTLPTALVLGAEGGGLRRLVRERCDRLASIPMQGRVGSLNVSVAAGVVLFEAARQRRLAAQLNH